jgi:exportin-7
MEDNPIMSVATLNMAQHFAACSNALSEFLKSLFEIVLFEECSNQWSISRPLLLSLIIEQIFNGLKAQILSTQPSIMIMLGSTQEIGIYGKNQKSLSSADINQ